MSRPSPLPPSSSGETYGELKSLEKLLAFILLCLTAIFVGSVFI